MLKKIKIRKLKAPPIGRPIRKIGRHIRGLLKPCDKCGAKMQEVFKIHRFSGGNEETNFFCRKCYSRMLRKPKEI
jgi:hypothetical protein